MISAGTSSRLVSMRKMPSQFTPLESPPDLSRLVCGEHDQRA
jgi:hypothetical protein